MTEEIVAKHKISVIPKKNLSERELLFHKIQDIGRWVNIDEISALTYSYKLWIRNIYSCVYVLRMCTMKNSGKVLSTEIIYFFDELNPNGKLLRKCM